jgi:adenylate cyclase
MADLIAQGSQAGFRWRRKLPDNQQAILGRASGALSVPWDEQISRQHVEVRWHSGRLSVNQLESGRNAVYFRGKEARQFELRPGEHFVIGETRFMVTADAAGVSLDVPQPAEEHTYSSTASSSCGW